MKRLFLKIYDKITARLRRKIVEDVMRENGSNIESLKDISYKLDILIKESNYPKYDSMNIIKNLENKKPKILIVGYYGGGSLGDDLMLESLLEKIDKNKYNITIMLSPNDRCDVTKYRNVGIIYVPIKIYELQMIGNYYDAIICGGGAVLDDWYYLLENYHMTFTTAILNLLYYFAINNKMIIVYGVSSNNILTNKEYVEKLNYVIKKSTHFSLRDSFSVDSLKKAGVDTEKLKIVDDLVLTSSNMLLKSKNKKNEIIKILVSFNMQVETEHCNTEIIDRLIKYLANVGIDNYEINLFPYYTFKGWDYPFLNKIKENLGDTRVIVGKHLDSFEQTLELFEKYDYFISARYHMALILNSLGKKFLLLNYDTHRHYINKNKYLYTHYKFDKNIINMSDLSKLESNYEKLFDNSMPKPLDKKIVENASKNLEKTIDILDDLFISGK